jgi:hypothetical protein
VDEPGKKCFPGCAAMVCLIYPENLTGILNVFTAVTITIAQALTKSFMKKHVYFNLEEFIKKMKTTDTYIEQKQPGNCVD